MPMNDYVEDGFFDTFAEGALNEGITTMDAGSMCFRNQQISETLWYSIIKTFWRMQE